jgi:hypothetical protein
MLEGKVEVKQPPVASTPVVRVVASRGEEVQVSCPVDGNPPPIIEWSKVSKTHQWVRLKGQCHEIFVPGFFIKQSP